MANQRRLNFDLSQFGKLFITGHPVKGVLKIITLNETTISRIKIGVIGEVCIQADENSNPTAFEKGFYSSAQHIFDSSDLLNAELDEQEVEFEVPIDTNLPPSVAIEDGSIQYYLYASMEEEFADKTTQTLNSKVGISIAKEVDCNTFPNADKEKVVRNDPVRSCLCVPLQVYDNCVKISQRAYVPGDCIKINAVFYNSNSYPLSYISVALVQKVKLKFEDRVVKAHNVISEAKRGCVMPGCPQVWRDEYLRIPPLPCTTHHKYLQVTYKVKLYSVKLRSNNHSETKSILKIPVYIGNLPHESVLSHLNPLPRCDLFNSNLLHISMPYQEFARAETSHLSNEHNRFLPEYITYVTELAMEDIELQDIN